MAQAVAPSGSRAIDAAAEAVIQSFRDCFMRRANGATQGCNPCFAPQKARNSFAQDADRKQFANVVGLTKGHEMNLKMTAAAAIAALMMAGGVASASVINNTGTCQFGTEEDFQASADVFTSTACVGELAGNDSSTVLNDPSNFDDGALFGSTSWQLDSKIERGDDEQSTVFLDPDPAGRLSATLDGDQLSGIWTVTNWDGVAKAMLVLKGGNGFAAYNLDLSAGLTGGWSTQALVVGNNNNTPALSHVSLYTTPIPLPAAGWLMLAGIGGLAALRRRKTV